MNKNGFLYVFLLFVSNVFAQTDSLTNVSLPDEEDLLKEFNIQTKSPYHFVNQSEVHEGQLENYVSRRFISLNDSLVISKKGYKEKFGGVVFEGVRYLKNKKELLAIGKRVEKNLTRFLLFFQSKSITFQTNSNNNVTLIGYNLSQNTFLVRFEGEKKFYTVEVWMYENEWLFSFLN